MGQGNGQGKGLFGPLVLYHQWGDGGSSKKARLMDQGFWFLSSGQAE